MTDLANLLPAAPGAESLAARLHAAEHSDQAVAQEFEGLFMSLVVKELRKAAPEGGLFAGDAADAYGSMFDLFMGQHLAQGGGIGIRRLVNTYLANARDR